MLGNTIDKVRDTVTNNPGRLHGATPQEALAKVEGWKKTRKQLWPLAAVVSGGMILYGLIFQ